MCISFPPYFDHDAFMHHTMHVGLLDASDKSRRLEVELGSLGYQVWSDWHNKVAPTSKRICFVRLVLGINDPFHVLAVMAVIVLKIMCFITLAL